jgi:glycosyltransferase involved in cell wall biosynthesis
MGILETMSYGKPVLATNAGGIREFMQDGQTGFLFEVGAVEDFAKQLLELSKNKEMVRELGIKAQARARFGFSGEKIVEQYLAYYQKVIKML